MKSIRNDVDWDDPKTTIDSKSLINSKSLLRHFYDSNYTFFKSEFNSVPEGRFLELGSGAGYIKDFIPNCITSDVLTLPFNDMQVNALEMPFKDDELSGICMIDVFHHIPDVEKFLSEAQRTLKKGGKLLMVEPANTWWGRFIYQNFHHEPFIPEAKEWQLPDGGPMSVANGALPWIVFNRDLESRTKIQFPNLKLVKNDVKFPLTYLLSGGLSYPQLLPKMIVQFLEVIFPSGMFYEIVVTKV